MINLNSNETPTLNGNPPRTPKLHTPNNPGEPYEKEQRQIHTRHAKPKEPEQLQHIDKQPNVHWQRNIFEKYIHGYQKRDKYHTSFQQGEPREHLIQMETGHRALSIASINTDNFTHHNKRRQITNMLLAQKIHVASIQESHIAQNLNYCTNGYRLITSAFPTKRKPVTTRTHKRWGGNTDTHGT